MLKRILGGMILIPIAILLAFWGVNFITGVLSGNVSLSAFLVDHRVLIGLIVAYFVYKWIRPGKKD